MDPAVYPCLGLSNGVWLKDFAASDNPKEMCKLCGLSPVARRAFDLFDKVVLKIEGSKLYANTSSTLSTLIPPMKEIYHLLPDEVVSNNRRDQRRGKTLGKCVMVEDGAVVLENWWDEPYGGTASSWYVLSDEDTLNMIETITVHGRTVTCVTVFKRQLEGSKPRSWFKS